MKTFEDLAKKATCEVYTLKIPEDLKRRCMWAKNNYR